jgi:uncharacterized protein (DUF433 family)
MTTESIVADCEHLDGEDLLAALFCAAEVTHLRRLT